MGTDKKAVPGMEDQPINDSLENALRKALAPRYFCLNGHVLAENLEKEPIHCPLCKATIVSKCECGHPLDLWYNYRGASGKPISGRDYCLMCKRITPWAFSKFLSPDGSSEFTSYEEALIEYLPHKPRPKLSD
jgi:hypothetical protein